MSQQPDLFGLMASQEILVLQDTYFRVGLHLLVRRMMDCDNFREVIVHALFSINLCVHIG